jgi:hypothetical protein
LKKLPIILQIENDYKEKIFSLSFLASLHPSKINATNFSIIVGISRKSPLPCPTGQIINQNETEI